MVRHMANSGHHVQLTASEVEEAIKAKAFEVARKRGFAPDAAEFHGRAVVHLGSANEKELLAAARVTAHVTWED